LGNVSALAAIIGIGWIAGRRLLSDAVGKTVAFDWIFIGNVLLIVTTGILAQIFREYLKSPVAYFVYYCHLVLIFFLFAYAPHSKFGHMFYRTAALVYARYSGRDKSVGVNLLETAKEALPEKTDAA
jgi:quinone-modifying oxidoreductase subunit QmoC